MKYFPYFQLCLALEWCYVTVKEGLGLFITEIWLESNSISVFIYQCLNNHIFSYLLFFWNLSSKMFFTLNFSVYLFYVDYIPFINYALSIMLYKSKPVSLNLLYKSILNISQDLFLVFGILRYVEDINLCYFL